MKSRALITVALLSLEASSFLGLARSPPSLPQTRSLNPSVWEITEKPTLPCDEVWLDLRPPAPVTFAQQALTQLFYAVRRVVDGANVPLPQGAGVQGVLFDVMKFDPNDAIGCGLPVYIALADGRIKNATMGSGDAVVSKARLQVATCTQAWQAVEGCDEGTLSAVAIPPMPKLRAQVLTGVEFGDDDPNASDTF